MGHITEEKYSWSWMVCALQERSGINYSSLPLLLIYCGSLEGMLKSFGGSFEMGRGLGGYCLGIVVEENNSD